MLEKHKGQAEWRELVVDDSYLRSEYVQASPGSGVKRAIHPGHADVVGGARWAR